MGTRKAAVNQPLPCISSQIYLQRLNATSNHNIFRDDKRVTLRPFQPLFLGNHYILITDYIFNQCTILNITFLHDDRVFNFDILADSDAPEQDAVFHLAADDTAIGKDAFANCPNLSDAPTARGNVLDCTWSNSNSGNDSNKETESTTPEQGTTTTDGLRPEFKEAMDSYEAFYDEYCDFMVKYKANPTDMKLITEYGDMLIKLSQMQEAFDAWEDEDLNDEELKYYLEVTNRITQKLIDIA